MLFKPSTVLHDRRKGNNQGLNIKCLLQNNSKIVHHDEHGKPWLGFVILHPGLKQCILDFYGDSSQAPGFDIIVILLLHYFQSDY